ncbi:DUF2854 domain-containing protein [Merismopedia glauca]|uniref:DUF2854 domain-containing protein n=1 Tax=Merismopedia glauca CCAP 1448/3 TaxID=1296344 RepID=A0A2T1C7V5_9CYAN|nr:DUF2854 domain-containing protein [Merismopedia glauca]PSB04362.1 hypothetical protein C7B64_04065 [Merismopedia glauca CCAP 1448/3]
MLRRISLANVGLVVGSVLTLVGFIAYANDNATLNLAGFFYGIPLLLGGLALKSAELKPIPFTQESSPEILALREQKATTTQKQVIGDVTRYRYGQDAHLDTSLKSLGLAPNKQEAAKLTGIRETKTDGAYTLVLEFDSPFIPFEVWEQKHDKLEKFFGPGVQVKLDRLPENKVEVAIAAV